MKIIITIFYQRQFYSLHNGNEFIGIKTQADRQTQLCDCKDGMENV